MIGEVAGVEAENGAERPPRGKDRVAAVENAGAGEFEFDLRPGAGRGRLKPDPRGAVDASRVPPELHLVHAQVVAEEQPHEVEGVGPVVGEAASAAAGGVQVPAVASGALLDHLLVPHGQRRDRYRLRQQVQQGADRIVAASVERGEQRQAALACVPGQTPGVLRARRQGLLHAHRASRHEGVVADREVRVVGDVDDDGVHVGRAQQLAVAAVALDVRGQSRGPMTPLCYVAAPGLDRRYRTPDGWVRTGDRGRLDAHGRLHVLGRLKQIVVRGGYDISPAEVEQALSAHPSLAEVVCVGVPDDELGERLCACVREGPGAPPVPLEQLTGFLETECGLERRKLPELLLRVREMPLGPTGKIGRPTLARLAGDYLAPAAARPAP